MKPGIYEDVTFDDYFALEAMSSGRLGLIIDDSPMDYQYALRHYREETPALKFGTASHCAVLEWDRFVDLRRSGEIDARGRGVEIEADRKPLGPRRIGADQSWLCTVLEWASNWDFDENSGPLIERNPIRSRENFPYEVNKNPRQPVADEAEYQALRAIADQVRTGGWVEQGPDEKRKFVSKRAPFLEMLDLAHWTGRRIGAIRQLRFSDLRLERTPDYPDGHIVWPGETDKQGKRRKGALTTEARAAIDRLMRAQGHIGNDDRCLFPSNHTNTGGQPFGYSAVRGWMLEAKRLAGVEHEPGSGAHSYRRKFVTERPHMNDAEIGAAAGMSPDTVAIYRQDNPARELEVLTSRRPLYKSKVGS